jgi:hypothetical protein
MRNFDVSDEAVKEIILGVKNLLIVPEHWTKGHTARDANGEAVRLNSGEDVCWCLTGALNKVCYERNPQDDGIILREYETVYTKIAKAIPDDVETRRLFGYPHVPDWNDVPERTHAEIIEVLDRALATDTVPSPEETE